jgi:hypothetical protein
VRRLVLAVAVGALALTACGASGTDVEIYRDKNGSCYVEIHENVSGGTDNDNKYPISCEIPERKDK